MTAPVDVESMPPTDDPAEEGDYVDVRVTARNASDLAAFIQLCKTIENLGKIGASRDIRVLVDGDGSADLRFDFGDTDTDAVELPDIDDEIVIGIGE